MENEGRSFYSDNGKSENNINDNVIGIMISLICIVMATVFLAVGISEVVKASRYESVQATITEIETIKKGNDTSNSVYVSYVVNGKDYNVRLNYWDATMYVGKQVQIKYNLDYPAEAVSGEISNYVLWIGLAALFEIVGVFLLIYSVINIRREKQLKEFSR